MIGPYEIRSGKIVYRGGKAFPSYEGTEPSLTRYKLDGPCVNDADGALDHVVLIGAYVRAAIHEFFASRGIFQVDLPLLTRSISSPGSLGPHPTIPSDVCPFEIRYFDFNESMYLSQSSQLYLEAYIARDSCKDGVYSLTKSFRNETSNFRHLAEFEHIEYEGRHDLDAILDVQEELVCSIVNQLVAKARQHLKAFLDDDNIEDLAELGRPFPRITFDEACRLLYTHTGDEKYRAKSERLAGFDAQAEILLSEVMGVQRPVFVTHYPIEEIAFYHAWEPRLPDMARNADCLFPGYGEVLGSGERVRTAADVYRKLTMFGLKMEDYKWYAELRESGLDQHIHAGFGMGIERLLCAVLRLPAIDWAQAFPRVSQALRP